VQQVGGGEAGCCCCRGQRKKGSIRLTAQVSGQSMRQGEIGASRTAGDAGNLQYRLLWCLAPLNSLHVLHYALHRVCPAAAEHEHDILPPSFHTIMPAALSSPRCCCILRACCVARCCAGRPL
jgi:hypothetical protein